MALGVRDAQVAARLVAIAVAELVLTSWMELTLPRASAAPPPDSPPASPELRRAAQERAQRHLPRSAGTGYVLAVGQAVGPFEGVGLAWGGGLRFGWTPGGAHVENDAWIWRPGLDLELTAARNGTSRGLGTVDVSIWSAALRVSFRLARGRSWFDAGGGRTGRCGPARRDAGRCHHDTRGDAGGDMGRTDRLRRRRAASLASGGRRRRRGGNRPAAGFGRGRRRPVHLRRGPLAIRNAGDRLGGMKAVVRASLAVVVAGGIAGGVAGGLACSGSSAKILERLDGGTPPSSNLRVDVFLVRSVSSCAVGPACASPDREQCFYVTDRSGARVQFDAAAPFRAARRSGDDGWIRTASAVLPPGPGRRRRGGGGRGYPRPADPRFPGQRRRHQPRHPDARSAGDRSRLLILQLRAFPGARRAGRGRAADGDPRDRFRLSRSPDPGIPIRGCLPGSIPAREPTGSPRA